ncbi:MAG: hypothetical protein ACAH80_11625 [Alphaproteobacteria bacterium]
MFFKKMKALEEKAESDLYTLSQQTHSDRTYIDMMQDRATAMRDTLGETRDKAKSNRNKAWMFWVCTGIANMFNPIGWLVLPVGLLSLAAGAVSGYQALKARAATECLKKFDAVSEGCFAAAQQARESYVEAQRLASWREYQSVAVPHKVAAAKPAADGFNTAASDLDLDQDITVRRIKLKTPAVAA